MDRRRSLDDFPDAILGHIISFLPTELAFQTSVLSKRWRYMWKSLRNLDFYKRPQGEYDDDERKRFIDFMDRVLCVHEAPSLNRFYLHCEFEVDTFRIRKWISTVVSRNVKNFTFIFSYNVDDFDDEYVFPNCLFSCESLESLRIFAYCDLLLPSPIYLPNLKILTLGDVNFKNYHELSLLFASSSLEKLAIHSCIWEGEEPRHWIISAPKLQKLTIQEGDRYDDDRYDDDLALCSVMVSAPLKTFDYYGGALVRDLKLSSSSSLVEATLLFDDKTVTENVDCFNELLRSVRLVKYLKLSACVLEGLSPNPVTLPIFKNLTSLELCIDPVDLGCNELEMFLNQCPLLETLKIPEGIISEEGEEEEEEDNIYRILSPNFSCLLSLKSIAIGSIKGYNKELVALQNLLAKATSLETMEISVTYDMDLSERKKLKTFLCAVPMGSESGKLIFKRDRCNLLSKELPFLVEE